MATMSLEPPEHHDYDMQSGGYAMDSVGSSTVGSALSTSSPENSSLCDSQERKNFRKQESINIDTCQTSLTTRLSASHISNLGNSASRDSPSSNGNRSVSQSILKRANIVHRSNSSNDKENSTNHVDPILCLPSPPTAEPQLFPFSTSSFSSLSTPKSSPTALGQSINSIDSQALSPIVQQPVNKILEPQQTQVETELISPTSLIKDPTHDLDIVHDEPIQRDEEQLAIVSSTTHNHPNSVESSHALLENTTAGLDQSFQFQPSRVPGTREFIFPKVEDQIPHGVQERFNIAVELFNGAVVQNSSLRQHIHEISYKLTFCGKSPETAVPTILVYCRQAIFKDLRKLFESRNIQCHYREQPTSRDPGWRNLLRSSVTSAPKRPSLRLLFWRTQGTPVERHAGDVKANIRTTSSITLCGSTIQIADRRATIALTLEMDSNFFGLTAGHVLESATTQYTTEKEGSLDSFQPQFEERMHELLKEFSSKKAKFQGNGGDNDINYDDVSIELWQDDASYDSVTSSPDDTTKQLSGEKGVQDGFVTDILSPLGSVTLPNDCLGPVDYMLVRIENSEYIRPNCLILKNESKPLFFDVVASAIPTVLTRVWMISGLHGPREGFLSPSATFWAADQTFELSSVWNMTLKDGKGICAGESGSIVIDAENLEIYGHVIASNPLGEALIAPFKETLKQIRREHGANLVIPSNMELLSNVCRIRHKTHGPYYDSIFFDIFKASAENKNFDTTRDLGNAAERGHILLVKALLDEGVDVDSRLPDGRTPLILAAEQGHDDIVKILLAHHASVNISNASNQTALFRAAEEGHGDAVKILLDYHAWVTLRDIQRRTPLHAALKIFQSQAKTSHRQIEAIVRLLLESGSDPNAYDQENMTPLHYLVKENRHDGDNKIPIELLIHGANPRFQANGALTPLNMAVVRGDIWLVNIMSTWVLTMPTSPDTHANYSPPPESDTGSSTLEASDRGQSQKLLPKFDASKIWQCNECGAGGILSGQPFCTNCGHFRCS